MHVTKLSAPFAALFALVVATHTGCAPAPRGPALDNDRAEHQVREAFDDAIDAGRHGNTRVVMSSLSDDFVLEVGGVRFGRDKAERVPLDRHVLHFDKITPDQAILVSAAGRFRCVEVWVRKPDGWKLARLQELATDAS